MKKLLKIGLCFFLIMALFLRIGKKETSVETNKTYRKIISLTLSGDEMLLSLVEADRIAALSGRINQDTDVSNVVKQAEMFPKIENNLEKIIELEPDFVIAADWMKKELLLQIREMGIPIYVYKTPDSFEEQKKLILDLASFLGEKKRGEEITNNMQKRLEVLQKKISVHPKTEKLRVLLYTSFETTSGEKTTFDDMLKQIGAVNVASEIGICGSKQISKEIVIDSNPDIIIIPVWKSYNTEEESSEKIFQDPGFQTVKAVREKKVYFLPYRQLTPTSQYMIDGMEALAEVIYGT
ncbi:MAG TPA: ABC transporter substrate-binding protein [Fusobacterium sp.]|uniref:ABC transporter substrate-binding protein n=1 Tax=Fusobacterium sp. TaxID=68766 RepID=UPI002F3E3468